MPRTPAQNEAIRQAQRQAILSTALPLFARGGIDGTPVSQIAKAAGVGHGTVFLYFPTKEELAAEVLTHYLGLFLEQLRSALHVPGSPLARLEHFTRFTLERMIQGSDLVLLAAHVFAQRDRFRNLAPLLYGFARSLTSDLVQVIRAGQEAGELLTGAPEATAWAFFALIQGIPVTVDGDPVGPFWDALINRALRLFGPVPQT